MIENHSTTHPLYVLYVLPSQDGESISGFVCLPDEEGNCSYQFQPCPETVPPPPVADSCSATVCCGTPSTIEDASEVCIRDTELEPSNHRHKKKRSLKSGNAYCKYLMMDRVAIAGTRACAHSNVQLLKCAKESALLRSHSMRHFAHLFSLHRNVSPPM